MDCIRFTDPRYNFSYGPFAEKPIRQFEKVSENPCSQLQGDVIGGYHAQKSRKDIKDHLEKAYHRKDSYHCYKGCFALERQNAIDDDLKNEWLDQSQ